MSKSEPKILDAGLGNDLPTVPSPLTLEAPHVRRELPRAVATKSMPRLQMLHVMPGFLLVNLDLFKVLVHPPGILSIVSEMKPRDDIVY